MQHDGFELHLKPKPCHGKRIALKQVIKGNLCVHTIFIGLFLRIENVFLYLQLLKGFVVGKKLITHYNYLQHKENMINLCGGEAGASSLQGISKHSGQ